MYITTIMQHAPGFSTMLWLGHAKQQRVANAAAASASHSQQSLYLQRLQRASAKPAQPADTKCSCSARTAAGV